MRTSHLEPTTRTAASRRARASVVSLALLAAASAAAALAGSVSPERAGAGLRAMAAMADAVAEAEVAGLHPDAAGGTTVRLVVARWLGGGNHAREIELTLQPRDDLHEGDRLIVFLRTLEPGVLEAVAPSRFLRLPGDMSPKVAEAVRAEIISAAARHRSAIDSSSAASPMAGGSDDVRRAGATVPRRLRVATERTLLFLMRERPGTASEVLAMLREDPDLAGAAAAAARAFFRRLLESGPHAIVDRELLDALVQLAGQANQTASPDLSRLIDDVLQVLEENEGQPIDAALDALAAGLTSGDE